MTDATHILDANDINPDDLMTPTQVTERLQVSLATLRNWRWKRVNLPYIKVHGGRRVRYLREDVEKFWETRYERVSPVEPDQEN